MDDETAHRLQRQVRGVKRWLRLLFLMLLIGLGLLAFIAYRVVQFTNTADRKITNIQHTTEQKLDLKSQLCNQATSSYVRQQFCE